MQRKRLQRAAGAAEVGAFIHIAIDRAWRGSNEQHLIAARCAAGMLPIFKVGVRHFKPRPKALASIPGRRGITGGVVGRRSTDTHLAKHSSYTFVRQIFQSDDDTTRIGCTLKLDGKALGALPRLWKPFPSLCAVLVHPACAPTRGFSAGAC